MNKYKGEVKFNFGDIKAIVRPDFETLAAIEDEIGGSFFEFFGNMQKGTPKISDVVRIVAAALSVAGVECDCKAVHENIIKHGAFNFVNEQFTDFVIATMSPPGLDSEAAGGDGDDDGDNKKN